MCGVVVNQLQVFLAVGGISGALLATVSPHLAEEPPKPIAPIPRVSKVDRPLKPRLITYRSRNR
jgi:hypothetical protein